MAPSNIKFYITCMILSLLISLSIADDMDLESLSMEEEDVIDNITSSTSISDASLGAPCDTELFEKHAPVHITQSGSLHEYNKTYQQMKLDITNAVYNSTDVCFHNKYFLQCSIETSKCQCATTGIWKHYNFLQIGNDCFVGGKGRCHPNKTSHLVCVNGTTCKKSDQKYDKLHKPQYLCSGSEPSFNQIQELMLWFIFVSVALIWRD